MRTKQETKLGFFVQQYLFNLLQITLGRTAKGQKVDVDLKLEGPAWKISRRQGVIKLKNSGEFYITNEGKRCLFVDGKPVSRIKLSMKLQEFFNGVVDILRFRSYSPLLPTGKL